MPTTKMITTAAPSKGDVADFAGRWENQMGSTMELYVDGTDVTGTYESSDGKGGTAKGPIRGTIDGDLIAFTVNWGAYQSITAWTGQLVGGTIRTLWLLVKNLEDEDEKDKLWTSTLTGADTFNRA